MLSSPAPQTRLPKTGAAGTNGHSAFTLGHSHSDLTRQPPQGLVPLVLSGRGAVYQGFQGKNLFASFAVTPEGSDRIARGGRRARPGLDRRLFPAL